MKSSAKIPASVFLIPAGLLSVSLLLLLFLLSGPGQKEESAGVVAEKEEQVSTGGEPVTQEEGRTVYAIGSVSKVYCAAAVMRLVDMGKVDLDAPVTDYIPEFHMADGRYREITVRMLLNHSSGLMGTTMSDDFLLGAPDSDYRTLFMDNLRKQRLKADPGEYGVYCNDGFTLAEIVVEKVSGTSFTDFLEKEFFLPLGITRTQDSDSAAPIYYGNHQLPAENIQSVGAGGLYASPEDVCRFAGIFTDGGRGLLSDQALQTMASKEYKRDKLCTREEAGLFGYGLGWDSVEAPPYSDYGFPAYTKGGDVMYHHASLTVLPEQDLSVCVASSGGVSLYCQLMAQDMITGILSMEKQWTDVLPEPEGEENRKEPDTSEKIPEALLSCAGIYASGEVWKAEFTEQNTLLLTSLENDRDAVCEFQYEGNGSFLSTQGDYIGPEGTLSHTQGGVAGSTRLSFLTEENGRSYMVGAVSMENALNGTGSAPTELLTPLAEKIEEAPPAEEIRKAWEARNGKKYYIVSEAGNSNYYLSTPFVRVELLSSVPGYTGTSGLIKTCRITDENSAKCFLQLPVTAGRDLVDYRFYKKDDVEYLELSNGLTLIEEQALRPSGQLDGAVLCGEKGNWYYVTAQDAGKELNIQLPEGGNYYVYDEYDDCVDSSLFKEQPTGFGSILLPEGGKILLAGAVGERFVIRPAGETR